MNRLFAICAFLLPCFAAAAQAASVVKFPEGEAAWVVYVSYSETSVGPSDLSQNEDPKMVEVFRKGDVRRNILHLMNDTVVENWRFDRIGLRVIDRGRPDAVYVVPDADPMLAIRAGVAFDESLFKWVSEENFVGHVKYSGKPCLHFRAEITVPFTEKNANIAPVVESQEAWIEEKTGLPVAFKSGVTSMQFRFLDEGVVDLKMPPSIERALARYRASLEPVRRKKAP